VCGDGIVETGEQCDDGNRVSGDGCSSDCRIETPTPLVDGGVLLGMDGGTRDTTSTGGSSVPFLQVAVGDNHTCAVRVDSTLWCWGNNASGQLRLASTKNRLSPANVGGTAWNRVSCGQSHSCSLRTDGSLSCWGNNSSGQLGDSTIGAGGQTEVVGNSAWKSVSAGSYQTCGVQQDGTLWCWGDDTNGQLGIGSLDNQSAPVLVAGAGFAHVSASYLHACATKDDGSMWCWGLNSDAQTGSNSGSYETSPVPLDSADWVDVTTGLYHSCGLKRDNTLWCWGGNKYGQIGNATIPAQDLSSTATAVQVDGIWQSISAGQSHTCAIKFDGSLWCWGDNSSGQLGTSSAIGSSVPTLVASLVETWTMVASGISHTCAIATDGSLWCWGDNTNGQLGLGNTTAHPLPTKVMQ
jgi:cysteine-rich repeat protein